MCDTPSHASDHLCQIWKEVIQKCMCYRVGMQDVPYFSSLIANLWLKDPEDIGEVQMSLCATHLLMLVIIGA